MKRFWMQLSVFLVFIFFYFEQVYASNTEQLTVVAQHGMVVSAQQLASQVGADILRAGGNAIDAAVAVGYALAVVNPCCGNIGGGGFMLIRFANGKSIFLNFREKAPLRADAALYVNHAHHNKDRPSRSSVLGYSAVAVPGTVLGLEVARKRYGTMTRKRLIYPAIQLAKQGFILSPFAAAQLSQSAHYFITQPNVTRIFMHQGQPYRAGEKLVQPELAKTLEAIASEGPKVFYQGRIARAIVDASQSQGGLLQLDDFKQYHVQWLSPIQCQYQGYDIISAPPPSAGGIVLCEMLHVLEQVKTLKTQDALRSANNMRWMIETMRYGFDDRNNKLGDPDRVNNPIKELLSKPYAMTIYDKIKQGRPSVAPAIHFKESGNTTHYSIVDSYGNAVSVTYTLNGFFGAKVIAGNTGFFLNNEMDDFTSWPGRLNKFMLKQSHLNCIGGGKRPLSSMTPTIVLRKKQLWMVLGSPGGPRIISTVLLTLLNKINAHMSLACSVNTPRFHYQGTPDIVDVESGAITPEVTRWLIQQGYHVVLHPRSWGAVEAILVNPKTHFLYGVSDGRRPDGAAVGC